MFRKFAVMIDYISGPVAELNPAVAVIDCGGVGYEINITLTDYPSLEGAKSAKLYIHEAIREDAHLLYGFLSRESRVLFRLLIGVSGVGANTARLILSAMTAAQLQSIIASGNDAALKSVKGIGAKTAQRIIVDLKDKIKAGADSLIPSVAATGENYDEALAALTTLGFPAAAVQKALKKVFAGTEPPASTEAAVKMALKLL